MAEKAKLIGNADDKICEICALIKSENPKIQFHLISEGSFYKPEDKFVCDHCLSWVREVREKCVKQCHNPEEDIFTDITFWHDPKKEGKSAIEVKGSTVLQKA